MLHPPSVDIKMLDDWKGVIDPKTRRTLQNRLNQRARSAYSPFKLNYQH